MSLEIIQSGVTSLDQPLVEQSKKKTRQLMIMQNDLIFLQGK